MLYQTSFEEVRNRLIETAQSQARFMESVARFDQVHSREKAFDDTLSQVREAHKNFEGFGDTGEFTLAKLENHQIIFLLSHRHHDLSKLRPVAIDALVAAPMRLALLGQSGWLVGLDYRGEEVLAAYEYVEVLNLGVVAKIDLSEIRAPFIRASLVSTAIAIFLVMIGTLLFYRISKQITQRVEKSEQLFSDTFAYAAIGLAQVGLDGSWLRVNQSLCEIVGYSQDELLFKTFQDITHPEDLDNDLHHVEELIAEKSDQYAMEKRYVRKDGSIVVVELTVALVRDKNGEPSYFISAVEDISARKEAEKALSEANQELGIKNEELEAAMAAFKTISGIVPLCAWCARAIQNEEGDWVKLETYIEHHTGAKISHGMCPSCQSKVTQEIKR